MKGQPEQNREPDCWVPTLTHLWNYCCGRLLIYWAQRTSDLYIAFRLDWRNFLIYIIIIYLYTLVLRVKGNHSQKLLLQRQILAQNQAKNGPKVDEWAKKIKCLFHKIGDIMVGAELLGVHIFINNKEKKFISENTDLRFSQRSVEFFHI